jgi:hypothetical protein
MEGRYKVREGLPVMSETLSRRGGSEHITQALYVEERRGGGFG